MEGIYIIGVFVSFFCHCMGLFYCPLEASTDSLVFMIMTTMFLHKLKVQYGLMHSYNPLDKITEMVILCLVMQVLLVVVWFPVHKVIQFLVDSVCTQHPNVLRSKIVDVIRDYTASVCVLAIELAVILNVFGIDDVQRLYGCKDDLVSDSTLTIVAKQEKTVRRREAQMWKK